MTKIVETDLCYTPLNLNTGNNNVTTNNLKVTWRETFTYKIPFVTRR